MDEQTRAELLKRRNGQRMNHLPNCMLRLVYQVEQRMASLADRGRPNSEAYNQASIPDHGGDNRVDRQRGQASEAPVPLDEEFGSNQFGADVLVSGSFDLSAPTLLDFFGASSSIDSSLSVLTLELCLCIRGIFAITSPTLRLSRHRI